MATAIIVEMVAVIKLNPTAKSISVERIADKIFPQSV